jgi:cation-transporting ATPase 13A2
LFIDEVLTPFYLFQYFSIILWFIEEYINYAVCILAITVISIVSEITDTIANTNNIRKMAMFKCKVDAFRFGKVVEISSDELVPGDLIVLPENAPEDF